MLCVHTHTWNKSQINSGKCTYLYRVSCTSWKQLRYFYYVTLFQQDWFLLKHVPIYLSTCSIFTSCEVVFRFEKNTVPIFSLFRPKVLCCFAIKVVSRNVKRLGIISKQQNEVHIYSQNYANNGIKIIHVILNLYNNNSQNWIGTYNLMHIAHKVNWRNVTLYKYKNC